MDFIGLRLMPPRLGVVEVQKIKVEIAKNINVEDVWFNVGTGEGLFGSWGRLGQGKVNMLSMSGESLLSPFLTC